MHSSPITRASHPAGAASLHSVAVGLLTLAVTVALACAPAAPSRLTSELAAHPSPTPSVRDGGRAQGWGLASGGVIPLWVDSVPDVAGWSPELVRLAYEAAREWDTHGVPVRFVRATGPHAAVVRVHWRWDVPWRGGGATQRVVNDRGETSGADCWIVLAPSGRGTTLPPAALRPVLLHELGHALGLPHDAAASAIMHPWSGPRAIAPRDRAALRALYEESGVGAAVLATSVGPVHDRPRR